MTAALLRSRAGRWGVGALLALGGLWLSLACLANAQSRALTTAEPWTALAWDPANPRARTRLAELYSESRTSPADTRAAQDFARSALVLAPLDGAALRVLGVEAQRSGDLAQAARLMAASDRVTRRDATAQLWLLDQAIQRGDFAQAVGKAQVVLAGAPGAAPQVFPVLRQSLGDPRAVGAIAEALSRRPVWRERFLEAAFARDADLQGARRLYAALAAAPAKPSEAETGLFIRRLVAAQALPEARDLWRPLARIQPGAADAEVYDGGFQGRAGPPPFNWRLASGGDGFAELGQSPDGQPALHVQFSTGAAQTLAEQLLVLPPGRYRLRGEARLGSPEVADQMSWTVSCAGGARVPIAQATVSAAPGPDWTVFEAAFETPAEGCAAQWLSLRGLAQDRFGTLEAWIRNVSVAPEPSRTAAAGAGRRS